MNNETHSAMTMTSDNASASSGEKLLMPTQAQVNSAIDIPEGVTLTPIGIRYCGDALDRDKYNRLFNTVVSFTKASNWLLGDTLDLAERTWGNRASGSKYAEASKSTGLSINTLRHIASVCHRIPIEERHPDLSFGHHQEALFGTNSEAECKAALDRAEDEKLSIRAFRKDLLERRAATMTEDDGVRDLPGELCPEDEASKWRFPCALEFARIADWIEHTDMMKVDDFDRENLLRVVLPTLRQLYYLLQIEKDANPDTELDVPFEIKPLD